MCDPVSIGIGIAVGAGVSATTAAITGQDVGKAALTGAVLGGVTGGIGAVSSGAAGSLANIGTQPFIATGTTLSTQAAGSIFTGVGAGLVGSTGAGLLGFMAPPEIPQTPAITARQTSVQSQIAQLNSQQLAVTGSGGPHARFSLAESIRRAKKRKLTQEDVADLSVDTSSFASTGLQLA